MSCKIIRALDEPVTQSFDWGAGNIAPHGAQSHARNQPHGHAMPDAGSDEQLQHALQQAKHQGFQEGARQAGESAQAQLQSAVNQTSARLAESLAEIAALRPRLRREAESQVVELALAIARKILHRTITMDDEALTGLVHAAVARIDARDLLSIRTAPCHHPQINAAVARLGLPSQVTVIADQRLEPGGLVLETGRGQLDASVTTQLAEIERGFTDYLEAGESS
jgi:flagellar assembly protein FliH